MRLCLLASLLTILAPALASCVSEETAAAPELESAQADEPTLFLATVSPEHDYVGCLAAADAIEGVDIFLELPLLLKFVATSTVRPGQAGRALLALQCVQSAEYDVVTRPDALCNEFAVSYCNKAAECLTPEELAQRGWTDPNACIASQGPAVCDLLDWCPLLDLDAGPACIAEVASESCELFRSSLGSTPMVYPACKEVCVGL